MPQCPATPQFPSFQSSNTAAQTSKFVPPPPFQDISFPDISSHRLSPTSSWSSCSPSQQLLGFWWEGELTGRRGCGECGFRWEGGGWRWWRFRLLVGITGRGGRGMGLLCCRRIRGALIIKTRVFCTGVLSCGVNWSSTPRCFVPILKSYCV